MLLIGPLSAMCVRWLTWSSYKIKSPGGNTPQGTNYTATIMKTIQARRTRHARHCWRSKEELISDVLQWTPHMAKQKQDDHLEHSYSSYARIRDVALKTCQRQWMIGRSGERGSGISVLAAWHDDDDDIRQQNEKDFYVMFTRLMRLCWSPDDVSDEQPKIPWMILPGAIQSTLSLK